jgi:hypothetical protein
MVKNIPRYSIAMTLQNLPNFPRIGIFGLKTNHLATLLQSHFLLDFYGSLFLPALSVRLGVHTLLFHLALTLAFSLLLFTFQPGSDLTKSYKPVVCPTTSSLNHP